MKESKVYFNGKKDKLDEYQNTIANQFEDYLRLRYILMI